MGARGEGFQPRRDRRTLTTKVSVLTPAPGPDTHGHTACRPLAPPLGPWPPPGGHRFWGISSGEDGLGPRSHSSQGQAEGVPAPHVPAVPGRR